MFSKLCEKASNLINTENKIKLSVGAAALSFFGVSFVFSENVDYPGIFANKKAYMGRTKNAVAALVTGLVAEKIDQNVDFKFQLEKPFWPDAEAQGSVKNGKIDSLVDLTFSSSEFVGTRAGGTVNKSEYDWDIQQINENTWHVGRMLMKFDSDLILNIQDGKITGEFVRSGNHFDWSINGTYDENGNVEIDVGIPFSNDLRIVGRVGE